MANTGKKPHAVFPSFHTQIKIRPALHPANISCFEDVFKTSWRRLQRNTFRFPRLLQDVFAIRLPKTSSRRLPDVFETCLQDVLQLGLQDVFKTSSRRVCKTSWNYVFKTSSRRLQDNKKRQKNVTMNTSSVRLHQDEWLLGNNSLAVPQKAELFTSLSIILP